MTKKSQTGLKAEQILNRALAQLISKLPHEKIDFPEHPPSPVVAEDYPDRYGCMIYNSATICTINGHDWILAQGENDGYYLTERCRADILALDLPSSQEDKGLCQIVRNEIAVSRFFNNSILLALSDGNLAALPHTRFEKSITGAIQPQLSEFIVQRSEYDSRYILASTLQHPTTKSMLYKPELIDFLAVVIENILINPPPKRRIYL
ncbi:MAG: hypothetical protein KJ955_04475 [Nanoarchaeota archaeon]|nr:hypothetical protein [Nanoarchaeota archaeon]